MSTFELSLSGFYAYTSPPPGVTDNGYTSFKLTVTRDGVIYGSGSDSPGAFVISGILVGDDIRFIKLYTETAVSQLGYIGKRLPTGNVKVFQFSGSWGPSDSDLTAGHWSLSGIASGTIPPPGPPVPPKPFEGKWEGIFYYGNNITQSPENIFNMSCTISLSPGAVYDPTGPNEISASDGQDAYGSKFTISGRCTNDGVFDAIKVYDETNNSAEWHYQGRFDGHSTVAGIWRKKSSSDINTNDAAGCFTLLKQGSDSKEYRVPTVESAIKLAAKSYNQGITGNVLIALGRLSAAGVKR